MTPVSDKAFAVMAVCPEAKKYYGITVDYLRRVPINSYGLSRLTKTRLKERDMTLKECTEAPSLILNIQDAHIAKANNSFFAPVVL